jgi:16S rRNA (guanine527-N7)-methyltransferase
MDIGSPEWNQLLIEGAAAMGVELRPDHTRLFARHAVELLKWNAVTNLTAITQPEDIARNHFLDALSPAPFIAPGSDLLDVGSGGGFPGLPLHIAIDGLRTTLIDAVRKKVSFLRYILRELALAGIAARHLRVEDLGGSGPADRLQTYDVITSRAFSAVAPFVRTVWPLVRPGGRVIALKGPISASEMGALETVGASGAIGGGITIERVGYSIPGLKSERMLVIVRRGS